VKQSEEVAEIEFFECLDCEYKVCAKCRVKAPPENKLLIEQAMEMVKLEDETHYCI
jgi:hypothetical protein